MGNSFETQGIWWLPENPSLSSPGILKFHPRKESSLELLLNESKTPFDSKDRQFEIIHGKSSEGKCFTLIGCLFKSISVTGDIGKAKMLVFEILKGFHLSSLNERLIRGARVKFNYLDRWVNKSGFKINAKKRKMNYDVIYRTPKARKLKIHDGLSVEIAFNHSIPFGSSWDGELDLYEHAVLHITTKSPESFQYFKKIIRVLQDFFSIASLRLAEPSSIMLEEAKNSGNKEKPFFQGAVLLDRNTYFDPMGGPPHPGDFLFRYTDVQEEIETLLKIWFDKSEMLWPSRILYISSLYAPEGSFVEPKFLSLCQAVETYHRRMHGGSYMQSADYEEQVLPLLERALPSSLGPSFKKSISMKLKFLHEYSLAKRIKLLFSEYKIILKDFMPANREFRNKVANGISGLRNELTHYGKTKDEKGIIGSEIGFFEDFLRVVLEISFLKEMGLPLDRIMDLAGSTQTYRIMFYKIPYIQKK